MAQQKLSALAVKNAVKPGMYGDGGGLWLQVTSTAWRSWVFRYSFNGRTREMGLGPLRDVSLGEAREKALALRKHVLNGIDPLEERDKEREAARLKAASAMTFKDASLAYIEAHKAGWRNSKHADQWNNTLRDYAYPVLGSLSVADISTALVLKVQAPRAIILSSRPIPSQPALLSGQIHAKRHGLHVRVRGREQTRMALHDPGVLNRKPERTGIGGINSTEETGTADQHPAQRTCRDSGLQAG